MKDPNAHLPWLSLVEEVNAASPFNDILDEIPEDVSTSRKGKLHDPGDVPCYTKDESPCDPSSHACRDHERENSTSALRRHALKSVLYLAEPSPFTYRDITENTRFSLIYDTYQLPFNAKTVMEKVTRIFRFSESCTDLCRISKYHLMLNRVATTHHARDTRCFYQSTFVLYESP